MTVLLATLRDLYTLPFSPEQNLHFVIFADTTTRMDLLYSISIGGQEVISFANNCVTGSSLSSYYLNICQLANQTHRAGSQEAQKFLENNQPNINRINLKSLLLFTPALP